MNNIEKFKLLNESMSGQFSGDAETKSCCYKLFTDPFIKSHIDGLVNDYHKYLPTYSYLGVNCYKDEGGCKLHMFPCDKHDKHLSNGLMVGKKKKPGMFGNLFGKHKG